MEKIIDGISKAVLDTTEKVVQDTGIGKLVENTTGIHVDPNIHDNGLHTEVKGPVAQVITLGQGDKVDYNLKIGDDDHTHLTHIDAGVQINKGDNTVLEGTAKIDQFGIEVQVGESNQNIICSGYHKIENTNSVSNTIQDLESKRPNDIPGYNQVIALLANQLSLDIYGVFSGCLDKVLKPIDSVLSFDKLINGLLGSSTELFSAYIAVSAGVEAGLRFQAIYNKEMPLTLNGQRVVFNKSELGASILQFGGDGGIALSDNNSKGFDGFDNSVFLTGSISDGATITCSLIINYNTNPEQKKIDNSVDQFKAVILESLVDYLKK